MVPFVRFRHSRARRIPCPFNPRSSDSNSSGSKRFDLDSHLTGAVRGGLRADPATGALLTPIYQSTTYRQEAVGVHKGHTYSRASNPTVSALEEALGALEDTPPAVCYATGMAAISGIFLALLKSGDHVVLSDVVYGGTVRLFDQVLGHLGIESSFVDTANPAAVKAAIRPSTRMVFIETPANPTLKLTDVAAIAAITRPQASCWSSTIPSSRRCCCVRSISARTSRCSRPPSTSKATTRPSAARSPRATKRSSIVCVSSARRSARFSLRMRHG